jgi:hypothetical protein
VTKLANAPILLTALLLLVSCSRQKTISADELRSDLTEAISVAAEAEAFLDYVAQGRSTENYANGHIRYLVEEAYRTAKQLQQAAPEVSTEKSLPESRKEVGSLAHELATVRAAMEYSEPFGDSRQNISNIRAALEQVKAGL